MSHPLTTVVLCSNAKRSMEWKHDLKRHRSLAEGRRGRERERGRHDPVLMFAALFSGVGVRTYYCGTVQKVRSSIIRPNVATRAFVIRVLEIRRRKEGPFVALTGLVARHWAPVAGVVAARRRTVPRWLVG